MKAQSEVAKEAGVNKIRITQRAKLWKIPFKRNKHGVFYSDDDGAFLSYKSASTFRKMISFDKKGFVIIMSKSGYEIKDIARKVGLRISTVEKIIVESSDNCITMESKMNRLKY